jgi:hypothetical protein
LTPAATVEIVDDGDRLSAVNACDYGAAEFFDPTGFRPSPNRGQLMQFVLQPWELAFAILASWINRQQQESNDYLRTENQVLREYIGKKRILLNDNQRRRLAVKGKMLGRKRLEEVGTLFTPDTILRWHRKLVARKWDYSDRRGSTIGRPRVRQVIVDLVVKLAKENPTWGYDRIQGALANVRYHICDTTVGNILKQHGIEPAPDRKRQTSWATFLKAHWDVLARSTSRPSKSGRKADW